MPHQAQRQHQARRNIEQINENHNTTGQSIQGSRACLDFRARVFAICNKTFVGAMGKGGNGVQLSSAEATWCSIAIKVTARRSDLVSFEAIGPCTQMEVRRDVNVLL